MNGTETLTVGPATLSDMDPLSVLVATAFHDLAPSRWLVDDAHARRQVLPGYFRLYVGFGLLRGSHARAGAPGSDSGSHARVGAPESDSGSHARVGAPESDSGSHARVGAPESDSAGHARAGAPESDSAGHARVGAPGGAHSGHGRSGPPGGDRAAGSGISSGWAAADRPDPLGGQPFDGGQVYKATVDGELVGAAIWLPVVPGIPELPSSYDRALTRVTGRWSERFQTFDLVLARHHPDEPPTPAHAHLTMLAVAPDWQGRGIGSALLRAHHQLLDRHGTPGYLEAADQRSRRLYARHGYHDVDPLPLALPGGGPPMWPMWRDPSP